MSHAMHTRFVSRRPLAALASILAALALVGVGGATAEAQPIEAGVNATPTALILFDSSGSMEWRDDDGDNTYPTCVPDGGTGLGSGISRMHSALEVLTGQVSNRYCATEIRDQDVRRIDQVDPTRPQGFRHSRICSQQGANADHATDCAPSTVDGAFPNLNQANNGLIDQFGDIIQFGFMAFDSFEEPSDCVDGHFSYGPSLTMPANTALGPDVPAPGAITSCSASTPGTTCWNLGGRRPFDPAYSDSCAGDVYQAMSVPPLDPTNTLTRAQINQQVEQEILRLVPYWSTPLGAMLSDALHMYTHTGADKYFTGRDTDGADYSRGYEDPYGECRRRYVLLITDGEPTYDTCVRTGNATSTDPWPAGCENYPYADPEFYAEALVDAGIPVYVVGFNTPSVDARNRLDAIAIAGGTESARFANSGLALIFELGDIFSQIAAGTPSRTSPANTTRVSLGDRGQYQFASNFEIHEGSPYWTGEVRRTARVCEDGSLSTTVEEVSVLDVPDPNDGLDELDVDELEALSIFTTSPNMHSCVGVGGDGTASLFNTASLGGVTNPLNEPYGVTQAEIAAACQANGRPAASTAVTTACETLTDGAVGLQFAFPAASASASCLFPLELSSVTDNNVLEMLGTPGDAQLASVLLSWQRGFKLSELRPGFQAQLDQLLPTLEFRWDSSTSTYRNDRRSRMGAVYHSSPVVVGVPDPTLEISTGYDTFAASVANRDSFLYVATMDGLMRAFNASTMEQEWAFMPSSVSHRLQETITSQGNLLDGTPVAADVRIGRTAGGADIWKTVLVFGYRGGGRGFTALDVTDPTAPKFMWELDAELDPQLGLTYSTPAVGTVFLSGDACPSGETTCERGVAVLGGGIAPDGFESTSNIGKVLYVVDLETGLVIRRFATMYDDTNTEVPLPAAIAGDVSLFDTFSGSLATRAFVGDTEGRLLRLDLSDANPANWRVDLFFDSTTVTSNPGAILFKPTIALRRTDGRAVVVFGTGNLDELHSASNENNFVASVVERPQFTGAGVFERMRGELNWALLLEANERVTTRPRIFNRRATWATFVPSANLCDIGGARLYQFDFLGPENLDSNGDQIPVVGPLGTSGFVSYLREQVNGPDDVAANPYVPFHDATVPSPSYIPPKSIIYSLEFVQRLSCFVEESLPDGRTWGGSQSQRLSEVNDGETVLQLGISTYLDGTGGTTAGADAQVVELDQGRVPASVFPTSWSVILE